MRRVQKHVCQVQNRNAAASTAKERVGLPYTYPRTMQQGSRVLSLAADTQTTCDADPHKSFCGWGLQEWRSSICLRW